MGRTRTVLLVLTAVAVLWWVAGFIVDRWYPVAGSFETTVNVTTFDEQQRISRTEFTATFVTSFDRDRAVQGDHISISVTWSSPKTELRIVGLDVIDERPTNRTLWARILDPPPQPSTRGRHDFELAIGPAAPHTIRVFAYFDNSDDRFQVWKSQVAKGNIGAQLIDGRLYPTFVASFVFEYVSITEVDYQRILIDKVSISGMASIFPVLWGLQLSGDLDGAGPVKGKNKETKPQIPSS